MRWVFALAALALTAQLWVATAQETRFLSAQDDLPLMPGFEESAEPVAFGSEFGQVVRSEAAGSASKDEVTRFYLATLPALGWNRDGAGLSFRREGETLTLSVLAGPEPGTLVVAYTHVAPLAPDATGR